MVFETSTNGEQVHEFIISEAFYTVSSLQTRSNIN